MAPRADRGGAPQPERLLGVLAVLAMAAIVTVVLALESGEGDPVRTDAPAADADAARVERVVDGDTIVVRVEGRTERVRYVGVDAPELANDETGTPPECGAADAADANRALVAGATVELERDASDRDRFGRLLRHVWIDLDGTRTLVTERLVADGAVEARSYPPDTRYDRRLDDAERAARGAGLGIWSAC